MKQTVIMGMLAVAIGCGSGCASTRQFVPFPNQSVSIENPEKGRIYVVRPTTFGAAVAMNVRDGNRTIGMTGPNGYLCWERDPGQTEVIGKAENTSKVPLTVVKGAVYYIQQHIRMGWVMARNKMELLDEAEGKRLVEGCKPPTVEKE